MVRNRFDQQMEKLNAQLIEMGQTVSDRLKDSVRALTERDVVLAEFIMKNDDDINEMEKAIEKRALKLLLRQQPVARDLRVISSALKMITDLERIGDQAADISELTLRITKLDGRKPADDLLKMAQVASNMVTESIKAFTKSDLSYIENIVEKDDVVDAAFNKVKNELIQDLKSETGNPEVTLDFLMIAKYLERIGDHAENISEWVVYTMTGKHVAPDKK